MIVQLLLEGYSVRSSVEPLQNTIVTRSGAGRFDGFGGGGVFGNGYGFGDESGRGGCFRKEEGYGFGFGDMLVDWVCDEDNNSPSLMVEPFISPTAYYVVNL